MAPKEHQRALAGVHGRAATLLNGGKAFSATARLKKGRTRLAASRRSEGA
jgi:hypothetical protein